MATLNKRTRRRRPDPPNFFASAISKRSKLKHHSEYLTSIKGKESDRRVVCTIYHACILPSLMYGCSAWWPRAQHARKTVEKCQRFMLQMCTNNFTIPYEQLIDMANSDRQRKWQPLWAHVFKYDMSLLYQYCHAIRVGPHVPIRQPSDLQIQLRSATNSVNQLQIDGFNVSDTESTRSTMIQRASRVWNELSDDVITAPLRTFKTIMKTKIESPAVTRNYLTEL